MSKNKSEIIIEAFEKAWLDANSIKLANDRSPWGFGVPKGKTKDEAMHNHIVSMYETLQAKPDWFDDSPLFIGLYEQGITFDDIMQALRIEFILDTV